MSKAVEEILNSILEDFKACKHAKEELEAKALFRLLNYYPPPAANVPPPEKPAELKCVVDAPTLRMMQRYADGGPDGIGRVGW